MFIIPGSPRRHNVASPIKAIDKVTHTSITEAAPHFRKPLIPHLAEVAPPFRPPVPLIRGRRGLETAELKAWEVEFRSIEHSRGPNFSRSSGRNR
ncbi:hypothetical protein [Brevibacterium sp. CT2-23B]|uniref:hypothetical protein n=1 Tax=Brevibacterium sp. CT2-23B TaxID=2729630 RepID=UPI001555DF66|nr:hypothetical protein [Brevibacterium sp. CT2-23B]